MPAGIKFEPAVKPLSLEEIQQRPEWDVLKPKQRMFVISYIRSGLDTGRYDAEFAVRSAYEMCEKSVAVMACQLLANKKIRAILDLHFGRSDRDKFLAELQETIRKAAPGSVSQVRAQSLYARMKFGVNDEPRVRSQEPEAEATDCGTFSEVNESPRVRVGDIIIIANGAKHRVLKIDEQGRPIEISDEEIA